MQKKQYPEYLTVIELHAARTIAIKQQQQLDFYEKMKSLYHGHELGMKVKILYLSPFIDQNGILRVGGRLQNHQL